MDADEKERDRRLYFKNLRNSGNDEGRRRNEKSVRGKTIPNRGKYSVTETRIL